MIARTVSTRRTCALHNSTFALHGVGATLLLSAATGPLLAGSVGLELVGHWGGTVRRVAVSGGLAYVPEGPRLTIYDVTDPANPTELGRSAVLSGVVEGLTIRGSLVYLAVADAGLEIVDASDPTAPRAVGRAETAGYARGLCAANDLVFVASGHAGLEIVDVSDPSAPVPLGRLDLDADAAGVAQAGEYAYVAGDDHHRERHGLFIVDVSDPKHPRRVSSVGEWEGAAVAVSDGYAFVAASDGLQAVDVRIPEEPVVVDSLRVRYESSRDIAVSDGVAYTANDFDGWHLVDVHVPDDLRLIGRYQPEGTARSVAVSGKTAFLVDLYRGVRVLDVSDPNDLR
jgi:hypothetical protein